MLGPRWLGAGSGLARSVGANTAAALGRRRARQLVAGKVVELEKDVSETDRFQRLLRYVYVDGKMVNAELVRGGFARSSSYPPDVKHQDGFRALEAEARTSGVGLATATWAEMAATVAEYQRQSDLACEDSWFALADGDLDRVEQFDAHEDDLHAEVERGWSLLDSLIGDALESRGSSWARVGGRP